MLAALMACFYHTYALSVKEVGFIGVQTKSSSNLFWSDGCLRQVNSSNNAFASYKSLPGHVM